MMRTFAVLTLWFAATVGYAQDPTKELEKLNGTWVVSSAETGGAKIPNDVIKEFKLTIRDGTFTARLGGDERKGTLRINTAKKPMEMNIIVETGTEKKAQLAIFDLQAGVLKVCLGDMEKMERPTDFETKSKPGSTLLVFAKAP